MITTTKVEKYITARQNNGMNILTLRKALVTLGQILNYSVRPRYIDHNPLREAERPRDPGEGKKDIVVLTVPEIQAFLAGVEDQKYRTMFMLAIMSGVREGELLGLEWGDLDLINIQLFVQRTFTKGRFFNTKTKTSTRRIDLGPAVISELKKWKLASPAIKKLAPRAGEHVPDEPPLDLIFPNEAGKPINYTNMVTRHFQPALKSMVAKNMEKGRAVKDLGDGVVGFPCVGHGFRSGEKIIITGTRKYDGERYVLLTSTLDQIQLRASYVKETMKASAWAILGENAAAFAKLLRFRFHTSGTHTLAF